MDNPLLAVVAVAALVAALVWGRSARRLLRVMERIEDELGPDAGATVLARAAYRKELHAVTLYALLAVASAVAAVSDEPEAVYALALILVPVGFSLLLGRDSGRVARLAEDQSLLERRAEEVLSQEELAPRRWAARLAPEDLPDFAGLRARPGVPGRHGTHGRRLLRRVPRRARPASPR